MIFIFLFAGIFLLLLALLVSKFVVAKRQGSPVAEPGPKIHRAVGKES